MRNLVAGLTAIFAVMTAVSAWSAEITVMRGSSVEVVDTSKTSNRPFVLRGSPAKAVDAPAEPKSTGGYVIGTVGGSPLWAVDGRGRLVACTLRGTGRVGERMIVCDH